MTIMNDAWITEMAEDQKMIEPFHKGPCPPRTISYGVTSYGYDLRVADDFMLCKSGTSAPLLDPKNFNEHVFQKWNCPTSIPWTNGPTAGIDIPPHGFVLARSVERIRVPRNIMVVAVGKSTYARVGLIVNVTPLEPEWEGYVTLEISNTTPVYARVYANEGICQLLFFKADQECITSYADKKGKYQDQLARIYGPTVKE